ncbi:uncharacterized protein G2W53_042630 [Senna tora]|uniref:Uncharacterized protein n=1 Tax=Senna tora TaxID=362788 RepID=A0A834SU66_9FABA|nr:uncharacterized protein G2W53_042630 [Senna tora]
MAASGPNLGLPNDAGPTLYNNYVGGPHHQPLLLHSPLSRLPHSSFNQS